MPLLGGSTGYDDVNQIYFELINGQMQKVSDAENKIVIYFVLYSILP